MDKFENVLIGINQADNVPKEPFQLITKVEFVNQMKKHNDRAKLTIKSKR